MNDLLDDIVKGCYVDGAREESSSGYSIKITANIN